MQFSRLNIDGVIRDCLSGRQAYRLKYDYDSEVFLMHGHQCLNEAAGFSYGCLIGRIMVIIGLRLLGKNSMNITVTRNLASLWSKK